MSTVLDLKGVTFWRETAPVLEDVHWVIRRGEHWALIGENGAGKTTLLSIVNGYIWPSRGAVEVLGERFGKTDIAALRRRIGWMSVGVGDQVDAFHPGDRVLEVVISGLYASIGLWVKATEEDRARAQEILRLFRCEHLAGRVFRSLSQGERQRALLARAFAADAELLILDEPCSGLDLRAREDLLEAVDLLAAQEEGPNLIYVTHHIEEVVPSFTHVLLLKRGRVVAAGPKEEVLRGEVLGEAFEVDVEVQWRHGRPWALLR